ncbi:MAG: hypothetical protein ACWA5P_07275 [bacterium]
MTKHTEEQLDRLSKKVVKNQKYTALTSDFTKNVMNQIEALPNATAYTPLITRNGWIGIVLVTLGTMYFALKGEGGGQPWLEEKFGWTRPEFNLGEALTQFEFSNVLAYSVVLFSAFLLLQIALVKKQQSQQFQF